tara:strand:+ start:694 stop:948 length:255 start_codon:yes stop_codon:yes gene_type:complete
METKTVMMPRELTAENGAKALLLGEFSVGDFIECGRCDGGDASSDDEYEECEFCEGQGGHHVNFAVDWPTIKAIYAKAVEHLGT